MTRLERFARWCSEPTQPRMYALVVYALAATAVVDIVRWLT